MVCVVLRWCGFGLVACELFCCLDLVLLGIRYVSRVLVNAGVVFCGYCGFVVGFAGLAGFGIRFGFLGFCKFTVCFLILGV